MSESTAKESVKRSDLSKLVRMYNAIRYPTHLKLELYSFFLPIQRLEWSHYL